MTRICPQGVQRLKEVDAKGNRHWVGVITEEADQVEALPVLGGAGEGQDNHATGVFHKPFIVLVLSGKGLPEGSGDRADLCERIGHRKAEDRKITLDLSSGTILTLHVLQGGHPQISWPGFREVTPRQQER